MKSVLYHVALQGGWTISIRYIRIFQRKGSPRVRIWDDRTVSSQASLAPAAAVRRVVILYRTL